MDLYLDRRRRTGKCSKYTLGTWNDDANRNKAIKESSMMLLQYKRRYTSVLRLGDGLPEVKPGKGSAANATLLCIVTYIHTQVQC